VLVQEAERCFQVRGVEFVRDAETEWTELPALLDDRVEEANSEHERSPFVVRLYLLEEVRVDSGVKGSEQTSSKTLRRLSCDLDGHL